MINIISYILPAVVGAYILINLGFKKDYISFISNVSLFVVLIFILNASVLIWGFNYSNIIIDFNTVGIKFMLKYLVLSLFWSVILAFLFWNIRKNIKFKVEEKILGEK